MPPDSATNPLVDSATHRNKSCYGGRIRAAALVAGCVQLSPRAMTIGAAFIALPHEQRCRGGDLVGEAGRSTPQRAAVEIGLAAQIEQAGQARGADRNAGRAAAPGPPKAVADDDANTGTIGIAKHALQVGRAQIGIERQQQRRLSTPPRKPVFDRSIPALAMTRPSRCSTMIRPGRARTTRRAPRRE